MYLHLAAEGAALDPALIPSPITADAQHVSHAFAAIAITLNILAFLVFAGRIWTRSYPVFRLSWDDYLIIVAYCLVLVDSILLLKTVPFIFNGRAAEVNLANVEDSERYAVIAQPFWSWGMATIKISVGAMLLRLEQEVFWRRFIWIMIGIMLTLAVYSTLTQMLQCIPLHKAWDLLGLTKGTCWSASAVRINLICTSVVNIATDLVFALLPITFLQKVQRPLRERVVIAILMGLGVFAAAASTAKAIFGADIGKSSDSIKTGVEVGMCALLEEQFGLIAACIPCLRQPFQKTLKYFGLISTQRTNTRGYGPMGINTPSGLKKNTATSRTTGVSEGSGIRMKNLRGASTSDAQSEENILPRDDSKPGEIWCTTEVEFGEEATRPDSRQVSSQRKESWTEAQQAQRQRDEWERSQHARAGVV